MSKEKGQRDAVRNESLRCLKAGDLDATVRLALEGIRLMEQAGLGSTTEILPGEFLAASWLGLTRLAVMMMFFQTQKKNTHK